MISTNHMNSGNNCAHNGYKLHSLSLVQLLCLLLMQLFLNLTQIHVIIQIDEYESCKDFAAGHVTEMV